MRFRDHYGRPPSPPADDALEPAQAPAPRRAAPWEAQAHEPAHAFELFQRYLFSETPSLAAFAREVGTPPAPLYALARAWAWQERRAAFRETIAREAAHGAQDAAQERGRAHALFLTGALEWAHTSLQAKIAAGEILEPREILAFGKMAIELERLIAGHASQRVALDLSRASPEALDALEAALEGVERAQAPAKAPAPN